MRRWSSVLLAAALVWACACGAPQAANQVTPATTSSGASQAAAGSKTDGATPSGSATQAGGTAQTAWAEIEAAANKEGSVTVYALSAVPPDQVGRLQEAWSKTYPNIRIDMTSGLTAPNITAKITAEQDAKAVTVDVAQLGGSSGRQLDSLGYLEPFIPPATQDPNVKWRIDPITDEARRGTLLVGTLSAIPVWVNTNLVSPADEPKTHMDLTDPKWKGKILWQTPWTAGYGWNEYYLSKKHYGPEWVTKMQAQDITFSQSQNDGINQLARGEFAIALSGSASDLANRLIQAGQPLKAVWTEDFVYGSANGFTTIKGAPHPNAARVFVNWLLTRDGQELYAQFGQFPNRSDIPPVQKWMLGYDRTKLFWYPTAEEDKNSAPMQKEAAAAFKG